MSEKAEKTPFNADAIRRRRRGFLGIDREMAIKAFFGGNALMAIVVLGLITLFLFKEGVEFFPQNRKSMQLYRASGQEMVGLVKSEVDTFDKLQRQLDAVQTAVLTALYDQGLTFEEVNAATEPLRDFVTTARGSIKPLKIVIKKGVRLTMEAKDKVIVHETRRNTAGADLSALMTAEQADVFLTETRRQVVAMRPDIREANRAFKVRLAETVDAAPTLDAAKDQAALLAYVQEAHAFLIKVGELERKFDDYDSEKRVSFFESVRSFLFGTQWITNSSWQDFYGVWPLLSGSLLVTLVALSLAVPLGIFAAIYVNQIATPREQGFIKPYVEFISAIPSVVIGFFGIAVFGESLRLLTEQSWLAWVPFFPISERLNAYTAGALLALMAVPTIFTLAEDAINNVPKAFSEASIATGATRWQTIWRITVPTALSGIISAVLLGFGRVIGETMVVLLCAGNRIAVPDITKGVGTVFEPVHTMTGIIAQEMGEVVPGSIHYRALFMVGILLFFFSLLVNYLAQKIVRKYRIAST
ncbi:MAG: phosphate transport system permease protein [Candidatus Promineifilaceae bacterium]|jgi:phosphate transport system permease protein